ncbi:MAG: oligosaccharide flippase family protein [Pseudomonadota bacterium]
MAKRVLVGSALLVTRSFAIKFIGLLSTLVLARVLAPQDFGLVALATLALSFLEVFSRTGSAQYVLRASSVDDQLVNSAWTLDMVLKLAASALLALSSGSISGYYAEPKVIPILLALSGMMAFETLRNPGLWLLEREQEFGRIVTLSIASKVFAATVGVTIAILFKSYWALVIGQVINSVCQVLGSYVAHAYRPRICTTGIRRQLRFSGWLVPQALLGYGRTQLDTFLVSSAFGNAQLGSFTTMKYLAFLPGAHILLPATHPLLAELAQSKSNSSHFRLQHNLSLLVTLALAMTLSLSLAGTAQPLIKFVLGEQWVPYHRLFLWFALLLPAYAAFHHATRTLLVFGQTNVALFYELFAALFIFVPVLTLGVEDLERFTSLRVRLELVASFLFLLATTLRFTGVVNTLKLLMLSLPVVMGAGVAFLATQPIPDTLPTFVYLIAFGATFSSAYALWLVALALLMRRTRECVYLLARGKAFGDMLRRRFR